MSPPDGAVAPDIDTDHAAAVLPAKATIVAAIAARHADAVDRNAMLPAEALAALKDQRMLGAMVPRELGGADASLAELAAIACTLGRACSATA